MAKNVSTLKANGKELSFYNISEYCKENGFNLERLPYSIRILVENQLRKFDGKVVKESDIANVATWKKSYEVPQELPFYPSRVLMQDFTGVPAVVDFAAMRNAMQRVGEDPSVINPLVRADLIIDHSIQTDFTATSDAIVKNMDKEFERNSERYELLKWAQGSLDNFKIYPPGSGIIHQINLEYIGQVVLEDENGMAYLDSCIGTDSHTVMINGLGIMGWGVGGIEAEATMLGQPYYMKIPQVVGVNLTGELKEGVTGTDLVLTIVERLRKENVVEKFVEFYGEGYKALTLNERAVFANMGPEYGATMGYCPIDEATIDFLKITGRADKAEVVEAYAKEQGLFYYGDDSQREYSSVVEINLSEIVPSVAGHKRPQDRIAISNLKEEYASILDEFFARKERKSVEIELEGEKYTLTDGSLAIASITSCTNTSSPDLVMGAALLARNAIEKGLTIPKYVKTSFGPGSKVVTDYLENADLQKYFDQLGFNCVGYGCLTCIGNSGPLNPVVDKAINDNDIIVSCAVSSNRNFEARVHQSVKTSFLASPLLVVAYALAGRIDIDFDKEPLGVDKDGNAVFFKDIAPKNTEIQAFVNNALAPEMFTKCYSTIFEGTKDWQDIKVSDAPTFDWNEKSTYIRNPSFFTNFKMELDEIADIKGARPLLMLGASVTTDHISPAGSIPKHYPAGQYLVENGIDPLDFNSYGSRRGNHEVMMRGTFGNVRLKNKLASKEGGFTTKFPEREEMFTFDASQKYQEEGTPLIIFGGTEYGNGSSRDWAAKGTLLLGVKAVIAESFERIHRSNLVGMGVLPLVFVDGQNAENLGLTGEEVFSIEGISNISACSLCKVTATKEDGSTIEFNVKNRLDTDIDVEYYKNGGILPAVMRSLANK